MCKLRSPSSLAIIWQKEAGFIYRIRQNIRGGKLSRFLQILAKRECFTIETFPASQLENNYRSQ